jgi:hypothetical protein
MEKDLHICACLEVGNFSASSVWIGRFKMRQNIAYRYLSDERKSIGAGECRRLEKVLTIARN